MKLIKNVRKRQMAKFQKKTELYYKKKYEEKINVLIADHADEIAKILKRKDQAIEKKFEWFELELQKASGQERKKYEIVLNERNKEIQRLREFISSHKQLFDSVGLKEDDVDNTIKKINHRFERGLNQIAEGFQIMQLAQKDIEDCKRKYLKESKKMQEVIEA